MIFLMTSQGGQNPVNIPALLRNYNIFSQDFNKFLLSIASIATTNVRVIADMKIAIGILQGLFIFIIFIMTVRIVRVRL